VRVVNLVDNGVHRWDPAEGIASLAPVAVPVLAEET